jgi:hypothetical protein
MKEFIGTWKLVAVEDRSASGDVVLPYGPNPAGLLIYDKTGHMSVQIMQRERPPLSSSDFRIVAGEELKSALAGFTAFFGTYEVDESEQTVIHIVQGHLLPGSVGKRLKRRYEFGGNGLILRPDDVRSVVWERAR